jgi:HAE1 family hydrophobic/amphiphilic exporter-1
MFTFLARLAVERPVLSSMLVGIMVVMGAFAYSSLGVDLMPEIDFPVITATTLYPGAGPEEVEVQVTERIEDAVSTLSNIESLTSYSRENVSIVVIEFDFSVDADLAAIDVKDKVDALKAEFPSDVEPPTIQKLDINAMPILDLALSGPQSLDVLSDFADDVVAERISRVQGVASVTVGGGLEREVEVLVHPDRLLAYGLSISDVAQLVSADNLNIPAGRVTEERGEYSVRVKGEYATVDEVAGLSLLLPNGGRIRLSDVATVRAGFEEGREISRYQRNPAVTLSVQKASDANTVATADGVMAVLEELESRLPPGAELVVAQDRSEFIRDAIRDILSNILIGIGLTVLVLYLFLHSVRGTIIAALAMPATIVATFLGLQQFDFTINVMTLMALGITVGILVTNTIVVLESIYRHLDEGADPQTAARDGTSEVGIAVAASALTNVVVFTPVAFMEGMGGQVFFAFGLTVVFATLMSVFISFTLAPMLAARLLRAMETEKVEHGRLGGFWHAIDRWVKSLESGYRRILGWSLRRPRNGWAVIGATSLAVVLAMASGTLIGGEFMPQQDEGMVQVGLELPPGTPLDRMGEVVTRAEELLADIPEATEILTTVGQGGGGVLSTGGDVNEAFLQITLETDLPTEAFLPPIRERMAALPDAEVTVTMAEGFGSGESPLQIFIKGPVQERLEAMAKEATERLAGIPGLVDVRNTIQEPRPEMVFHPHRGLLTEYGLTVGQVGGLLRTSIEGATPSVLREDGEERDIRVRLAQAARDRAHELEGLQVRTPVGMVPVGALGELTQEGGETMILRDEKERTVRIDAEMGSGSLTELVALIQGSMDEMEFPPGYSYEVAGDFEQFEETLGEMAKALLMAVVLTYIVLGMILESYVHPVTIMLTLPLGAVGAVFALFLTSQNLNIFSMMAMIMLVGIVVNNAILILDFAQNLRSRGKELVDALLEAAPARLRPIIMTNIAIAVALIPQAVGSGAGSFYRIPMAVVTIGGVLVAAFFTLFLIPVIYQKLDRFAFAARIHASEALDRENMSHRRRTTDWPTDEEGKVVGGRRATDPPAPEEGGHG